MLIIESLPGVVIEWNKVLPLLAHWVPVVDGKVLTRDIKRLSTTPFSLVLPKEYFESPQRDSHAVRYI
jgi:hypothetical protein